MTKEYNHELMKQIDSKEISILYRRYVKELLVCLEEDGCTTLEAAEERLCADGVVLDTMEFEKGPVASCLGILRNMRKANEPCYDSTIKEALRVIRLTKDKER